jgi:nucleoside phosphorylase
MRILILSAFKNELEIFEKNLIDLKEIFIGISKRRCLKGVSGIHEIYTSYTGIGTMRAAATTTVLCEYLNPDLIVICGVSGGLTANQQIGDLIISQTVIDIDLHHLPNLLVGTPYEICLTNPHTTLPLHVEYIAHPELLAICKTIDMPRIKIGKIVTSNTFPLPRDALEKIKALQCDAIEMENAGVFYAASYYHTPVIAVRAISNNIDNQGNDLGTTPNAIAVCAERLAHFLNHLIHSDKLNNFVRIGDQ